MVNGRFLVAGVGCIGFSFMLFAVLRFSLEQIQKATSPEGIAWMYFIHMMSAVVGVILILIGIFKKKSSM